MYDLKSFLLLGLVPFQLIFLTYLPFSLYYSRYGNWRIFKIATRGRGRIRGGFAIGETFVGFG